MKTGVRIVDYPAEHGLETTMVEALDGTRLRVLIGGNPNGPRLLCVHGFPQNAAEWRRLLPFVRERFCVICLDLRGFAGSDVAKSGDYSLQTLVADLETVVEKTASRGAPGPVHLVAHDWGGPIAWGLVAKRPELVAHFVAVNAPHQRAYTRQLLRNREQLRGGWYTLLFQVPGIEHLLSANGAVAFVNTLRRSSVRGTFTDEDVELYAGPLRDPARLRACLSYYRAGFKLLLRSGRRALREPSNPVRVPTIIVWGERDTAVHVSVAEATKREFCPNAELRLVPDATHWVPDERPDLVARAILDGLSRVTGNRADIRGFGASG